MVIPINGVVSFSCNENELSLAKNHISLKYFWFYKIIWFTFQFEILFFPHDNIKGKFAEVSKRSVDALLDTCYIFISDVKKFWACIQNIYFNDFHALNIY